MANDYSATAINRYGPGELVRIVEEFTEINVELKKANGMLEHLIARLSLLPNLVVSNSTMGGDGRLEVLLAGWDGSGWKERHYATLSPGEDCGVKLNPVTEDDWKSGEQLLLRFPDGGRSGKSVLYRLKNDTDAIAHVFAVKPAVFPWWEAANLVFTHSWTDKSPFKMQPPGVKLDYAADVGADDDEQIVAYHPAI